MGEAQQELSRELLAHVESLRSTLDDMSNRLGTTGGNSSSNNNANSNTDGGT